MLLIPTKNVEEASYLIWSDFPRLIPLAARSARDFILPSACFLPPSRCFGFSWLSRLNLA
jgi:hypothetical protein